MAVKNLYPIKLFAYDRFRPGRLYHQDMLEAGAIILFDRCEALGVQLFETYPGTTAMCLSANPNVHVVGILLGLNKSGLDFTDRHMEYSTNHRQYLPIRIGSGAMRNVLSGWAYVQSTALNSTARKLDTIYDASTIRSSHRQSAY